jgi:tetratricopeptide (TPR) repeat protein
MVADFFLAAVPLGDAYLITGRHDEALQVAAQALDLSRKHNFRASQAYALQLLGVIHAQQGDRGAEEATAHFRQALALAETLEMRPLQARCHLGLSKLYRRMGRSDEAHAELGRAAEMLCEMGMTFWLPEAEAELAAASSAPVD